MIISEKLEKYNKNRIESIKKMKNGFDKDMAIGALVQDLGKRSITPIAKTIGSCFRKVKKCHNLFKNGYKQLSLEFRGRKRLTEKYPNLIRNISSIIDNYLQADSHFKTDTLYITITPGSIIDVLVKEYGYPQKFACRNSITNILHKLGYKYCPISKSKVLDKIPQTDSIFENVFDELEAVKDTDDTVAAISIDDKATKKIGDISDNGKTWIYTKTLDHDTTFSHSVKPFGILDLKTNETFVTCTPYNSTAYFKADCIDNYIKQKGNLKKLVIFLDNGPENSGRRTAWLKALVNLAKKHNIVIKLVYYPPYHSKYNKIERYWARLQLFWRNIIIDTLDKLIECVNKVTWKGVRSKCILSSIVYEKKVTISESEMKDINTHLIREEGLEKWSIVITPYAS